MISALVLSLLSAPPAALRVTAPEGHLRLESGVLSGPLVGELEQAARAWVLSRRAQSGLPDSSTLGPATGFGTRFGGSLHFPQQLDGVDVFAGRVVVTVDGSKRVVRVASSAVPYAAALRSWKLSPRAALMAAGREIDGALLQRDGTPYGGTRRFYFAVGPTLHAGYLVHVPTLRATENWYLAVDAADGSILFSQNRLYTSNAVQVYEKSPGGLDAGVGRTPLINATLSRLPAARDGGFLSGDQLTAYNCCPNRGCDADAGVGPRRATGTLQTFQGTMEYDFAICDRVQRATNDPAAHASGDFVYAPADPPLSRLSSQADPADSDPFAEVHAFFHVNSVYDYIRSLSGTLHGLPAFQMRDEKRGKVPAVWSNVAMPDTEKAARNPQGVLVGDQLSRVDNAAFVAVENFDSLTFPEYKLDVDTLLIFQGDKADFAYDAPVLWHEFGHGVIHSTAAFEPFIHLDERSANEETGALHEAFADYFAAAFGQDSRVGTYVGPRLGSPIALRDVDNTLACPDVLWGEPHQDSQHFSGALWQARQTLFAGGDSGRTFDAAVYAALVSMTPRTDFELAAAAITAQVGQAFPQVAGASGKMQAVFRDRGVISCSKVVDLEASSPPRKYYALPGSGELGVADGSAVPGPYQMRFKLPHGAKSLQLSVPYFSFNGSARMKLLLKSGQPIRFTRNGTELTNDADREVVPTLADGKAEAKVVIDVPCGGELYFTLANSSRRGRALQELSATYDPADECPAAPDAGTPPDAGVEDAGVDPVSVPAVTPSAEEAGGRAAGCGCSGTAVTAAWWVVGLLGWAGALGRRRRR